VGGAISVTLIASLHLLLFGASSSALDNLVVIREERDRE
jgi:hypothetical protein